ncbi:MAG: prepilin peptidase [Pseudohongiellaceae bacterium]
MDIIHYLNNNPPVLLGTFFLFGLLVGSFLNVVIYRLPIMLERAWQASIMQATLQTNTTESNVIQAAAQQANTAQSTAQSINTSSDAGEAPAFNLFTPGSHCPRCKQPVRVWQNIPILSYLLLRAKCARCKFPIDMRYPMVELFTALLSVYVAMEFGAGLLTLTLLILIWSLIVLAFIDIEHQLLPDDITLPLLWLGLLTNTFVPGLGVSTADAIIGAAAGYTALWLFYQLFKLLTSKEGMGYGDFKLLAVLGAWLGWQSLLPIILIASLLGTLHGLCLILVQGQDRNIPIPFGIFLTIAGIIVLFRGSDIIAFWLAFII